MFTAPRTGTLSTLEVYSKDTFEGIPRIEIFYYWEKPQMPFTQPALKELNSGLVRCGCKLQGSSGLSERALVLGGASSFHYTTLPLTVGAWPGMAQIPKPFSLS